jgi:hypothetical protein
VFLFIRKRRCFVEWNPKNLQLRSTKFCKT